MSDPVTSHPFSGSNSNVFTFPVIGHFVVLYNHGSAPLTFTVGDRNKPDRSGVHTLLPGYSIDERFEPFDRVTIEATGEYHGWIRRGAPNEWRFSAEFLYR